MKHRVATLPNFESVVPLSAAASPGEGISTMHSYIGLAMALHAVRTAFYEGCHF